jgi:hypothetical protein
MEDIFWDIVSIVALASIGFFFGGFIGMMLVIIAIIILAKR